MNYITALMMWRYFTASTKGHTTGIMIRLCIAAIFIGSFSLALVIAVMNGFEKTMYKKMQSIHSDIIIKDFSGRALRYETIAKMLNNDYKKDIIAHAPHIIQHALIESPRSSSNNQPLSVVLLQGVNPTQESQMNSLQPFLTAPDATSLEAILINNHVIIGHQIAHTHGLSVGDTCTLLLNSNDEDDNISLEKATVRVGGICKTGIEEFDQSLVIGSISLIESLIPDAPVSEIHVAINHTTDQDALIKSLQEKTQLSIKSWKELYPSFIAALILERYAMTIILSLIALVACINIISLLFMLITEKKSHIALMTCMGMHRTDIYTIFFALGMFISLAPTAVGIMAATTVSCLLNTFPCIQLPDSYYISYIPCCMEIKIALFVFCLVCSITALALLIPLKNIKSINAAHILRYEG